jgi:pSer/pThr/pTyr-binding forkhead associated (FHA) protein
MDENRDLTELVDMDEIVAQQEGEPIHLLQVEGEGSERWFRVLPMQRAILGRSSDAAIHVEETGVSRQHALIEHQEGVPHLVDLGSTNGTFLNGRRIDNETIHTGDRIQIGSATFEVTVGKDHGPGSIREGTDPEVRQEIAEIRQKLQQSPSGSGPVAVQQTVLAGSLANIGLPSLLQTLEANRNSGTLMLHFDELRGQIHLADGLPVHARLGPTRGKKALFRLVGRSDGRFEFLEPGFEPQRATIEGRLDGLLLEAVTELDEFTQYRSELPPDDTELVFTENRFFVLSRMPPDLFEVLACIARHRQVGPIIDECSLSDLEVVRHLLMLFNEKIITLAVEEPS